MADAEGSPYNLRNILITLNAKIDVKTSLFMLFNLVSSPTLIFINKSIFHDYHYNFATALTCMHFFCTGIGLWCCARMKLFQPKEIPFTALIPLVICNTVCTPLANLSMQMNSLGFYQVMKIAITPCVVAMEYFVYRKTLDRRLALCLVPVCIGVTICTVTDVEVRLFGAIVASMMTLSTVFVQVVFKNFQEKHKVDSMQLLFYVMPMSAVAQLLTLPLTEDMAALRAFDYSSHFMGIMALSGFMAFCVNLSGFLVIGKATPVTYNVVTHCKTVVVILGGFVLFASPLILKNLIGILITLFGAWSYAYCKLMGVKDTETLKTTDGDLEAPSVPPPQLPGYPGTSKSEDI